MDSSPSDLTLDYTPNGNGGHPMTPKQAPPLVHQEQQHNLTAAEQASGATIQKLQEFLSRLDDERLKIDAFKRELPLCMQLLNQAMEAYRQQLEACQTGSGCHGGAAGPGPGRAPLVLEEFIPLSKNIGAAAEVQNQKAGAENPKASWMVSAQLWNGSSADAPQTPKERSEHPPALDAGGGGNAAGAFLPFTKEMIGSHGPAAAALLPELALAPGAEKDAMATGDKKPYLLPHDAGGGGNLGASRRDDGGSPATTAAAAAEAGQAAPPQTNRKARRCWSPELHRRFVNALQILGGAQVATPKQIRELMKVDGLTNDEVKSHLQKYRLHTRRPMQAPTAPPAGAPQLVVLGGIWMPPDYAAQAAGPAAIYGAHPATQAHYTAAVSSAAAQEYYHSAAAQHHHMQHHHHTAAAMAHGRAVAPQPPPPAAYKVHRPAAASPESEGRGSGGGRERSESIEEEGEGEDEEDDEDGLVANADADADEIKY